MSETVTPHLRKQEYPKVGYLLVVFVWLFFLTVAFCLVGCSLACWCKVFVFVGWLVDLVWSLIGLFWEVVFGFCDCSFFIIIIIIRDRSQSAAS